jgi:hypothetical protein
MSLQEEIHAERVAAELEQSVAAQPGKILTPWEGLILHWCHRVKQALAILQAASVERHAAGASASSALKGSCGHDETLSRLRQFDNALCDSEKARIELVGARAGLVKAVKSANARNVCDVDLNGAILTTETRGIRRATGCIL